jgi:glucose-6-phosphate isomerase
MLTDLPAWKALQAHRRALESVHMRDLFAADPRRFDRFHVKSGGILFDYSKHRVTEETMALLLDLAKARDVEGWRKRMFAGDKINTSENRAVLHTALRRPATDKLVVDGEDVMPFIHATLQRMASFSQAVRQGQWTGYTGKRIKTVVNIGIGGSDLGPQMVCEALKHLPDALDTRFVSNVDGAHIVLTLRGLDPETTLFVVASKTFTTQETMTNAATARDWLLAALKDKKAVANHFVALSTNEKAVAEFGIAPENMFPFRDWVGGRYSLWSSIGLPICLAYGFETFRALLDGAYAMDRHFQDAPLEKNIPVIMALLGLWYRDFWDTQSYAVLPYSQNLHRLPAFLQQLDMESNGKGVDRGGKPVPCPTGPVVFGEPGTGNQHSFMQLIHQGTALAPCDFIGFVAAPVPSGDHNRLLLANLVAQSQALMQGRTLAEAGGDPQRVFSGNRPSTTLLLDRLDARHLGMLLALYEHKVFVQGILWNINSFDQWGVELGKTLAGRILESMDAGGPDDADSSTKSLLAHIGRPS